MSNINDCVDISNLLPGFYFYPGDRGEIYEFILDNFFISKRYCDKKRYYHKDLIDNLFLIGFFDSPEFKFITPIDYIFNIIKNESGNFCCLLYPKLLSKKSYASFIGLDKYIKKMIYPQGLHDDSLCSDLRRALFDFKSDVKDKLSQEHYLSLYCLIYFFVAIDKSILLSKIEGVSAVDKFKDIWRDGVNNSSIIDFDLFCFADDLGNLGNLDDLDDSDGEYDLNNAEYLSNFLFYNGSCGTLSEGGSRPPEI